MMLDSLRNLQEQLIEYWKSIEKNKKIKIVAISFVLILTITAGLLYLTRTKYEVLYGNLSLKDMAEVSARLDEMGITWKSSDDQRSILVAAEDKSRAKIELANYGLPKEGYTYTDAFNDSSWTMTDYDKKQREKLALRSELASKISDISGIASAEVFISEKESTSFILENEDTKTTASVYIEKSSRNPISAEKVNSIKHLVASAVTMNVEDVTVIDDDGKLLGQENEDELFGTDVYTVKEGLEARINNSIIKFLENIVGIGNVDVMSSVNINMDSEKTTIVEFAPPIEGNEEGLIRSLEEVEENMIGGTVGGPPGTETNIEDNQSLDDDGNRYSKVSRVINNELNEINREIRKAPGEVSAITVAVLINKDALLDGELTQERQEELTELIYAATGLDTKQVQISAENFSKPIMDIEGDTAASFNLVYIILGTLALLALVIGYILYDRSKKKKLEEEEYEEIMLEKTMIQEDVDELEFKEEESNMKSQINKFVEKKPEAVVQLLRNWLNE